jgi:hypothetical protein
MVSATMNTLSEIDSLLRKSSLESKELGLKKLAELLQQEATRSASMSSSSVAYSALLTLSEYFSETSNKFRQTILRHLIPIQKDLAKIQVQKTTELMKRFEALLILEDCQTRTLTFL